MGKTAVARLRPPDQLGRARKLASLVQPGTRVVFSRIAERLATPESETNCAVTLASAAPAASSSARRSSSARWSRSAPVARAAADRGHRPCAASVDGLADVDAPSSKRQRRRAAVPAYTCQ